MMYMRDDGEESSSYTQDSVNQQAGYDTAPFTDDYPQDAHASTGDIGADDTAAAINNNTPPIQIDSIPIPPNATLAEKVDACILIGGLWLEEHRECDMLAAGISLDEYETFCTQKLGGIYNECASACRHDTFAGACTENCVQVCSL